MAKKAIAVVVMALLVGGGVIGSISSASAADPLRALERRVTRLENKLDSLAATVQSLKGTNNCLALDDVTQYDDYASIDGGSVTGLDYTGSGDSVDSVIVVWVCPGSP